MTRRIRLLASWLGRHLPASPDRPPAGKGF